MAFGVKYRMDFKDQFEGDDFRVDIEKEDYVSSIIGLGHHVDNAFTLEYNSSDESDDWVIGSEGQVVFTVSQSDTAAFDADFYDSAFRNMKVKFFVNSVLKWVGWLKPENTTRQFLGPVVAYTLSATDGLKDLENIEYTGFENTGKQSGLQIIKNALNFNALDDIDIQIQCNLFEDQLMVAGQNVFNIIQNNNEQFYTVEDGEQRGDKCFEVLEKTVKPYYCRLYQSDGFWKIVNGQEYVTEVDTYDYTTLAFSGSSDVAVDRRVSIGTHERPVENQFEKSKIPPLKTLRTIFRNKNLGSNELAVNHDFEDGGTPPSGWTNSGWDTFKTTLESGNNVGECTHNTTNGDQKHIFPASFVLSGVATEGDTLLVRFKVKLKTISVADDDDNFPQVFASLIDPSLVEVNGTLITITEIDGGFTTIEHAFDVSVNGTYSVHLNVAPAVALDQMTYYFDDVEFIHSGTVNTTTDSLFVNVLSAEAYKEKEEIIHFADSLQISDIGALSDGTNLTKSWTRFGESAEQLSLAKLFGRQFLNDQRDFQNLLTIELYDRTEVLSFNAIVTFESKTYRFTDYSKNYKTQLLSATMLEVDNVIDASHVHSPQSLTSVRGESIPGSEGSIIVNWDNIINKPASFDRASSLLTGTVVFDDIIVDRGLVTGISTRSMNVATELDGLSDVSVSLEADFDVLSFNSGGNEFINRSLSEAGIAADNHTHSTFDRITNVLGTDKVFSDIVVTNGITTAIAIRSLSPADIGASPVGHTHETFDNSGALAGTTVYDEINVTDGIVTSLSTKSLTIPTNIDDLGDVTITTVGDGEILEFDSGSNDWINRTLAEAGIAADNHQHSAFDRPTSVLSGDVIFSDIVVLNGITTAISTRSLSAADIGAATTGHQHSAFDNSGALTGTTVYDEINVTNGIVTSLSTKVLAIANTIGDLDDVNITTVGDNEVLAFDSGSNDWINQTPAEAGLAATNHTHSAFDRASSVLSGATVFSNIVVTDGITTAIATRNLTASDIGAEPADSDITKKNESESISGGWTWTGNFIRMNDNVEIHFGTSTSQSDITSDGTNTIWDLISGDLQIRDAGTTDFLLKGDGTAVFHADGNIIGRSDAISSDIRLKKNIEKICPKDALAGIMKLRGISFEWKDRDLGIQAGYIAQEIEKIWPDIVVEEKRLNVEEGEDPDELYKFVSYSQVTPYITQAMKEQQRLINQQGKQLRELKEELNKLKV